MKSKYIFFLFMFAALACSKQDVATSPESEKVVRLSFSASSEGQTKALLDFPAVKWQNTDVVKVFSSSSSADFTVAPNSIISGNETTAVFEGEIALGDGTYYAVYPSTQAVGRNGDVVKATVPSCQTVSASTQSADPDALVCIAKTEDKYFTFKNLCSLIKVNTPSDTPIYGIVVESTDGSAIAGTASISFVDGVPAVSSVENGSDCVFLAPETGSFTQGGAYYLAVLPGIALNNLKISFRKNVSIPAEEYSITSSSTGNLARNNSYEITAANVSASWASPKTPTYVVRNSGEFSSLVSEGAFTKDIFLGNDIDMSGVTSWSAPNLTDKTFDGRGHNIHNLTLSGNTPLTFFGEVSNSTIRNVNFGTADGQNADGVSSFTMTSTEATSYLGLIKKITTNAAVNSVKNFIPMSISNSVVNDNTLYFGAICAYADITAATSFTDCENNADLTNTTNYKNTYFSGILGYNDSQTDGLVTTMSACSNRGAIVNDVPTASSNSNRFHCVSGICANSGDNSSSKPEIKIFDCNNSGAVSTYGSCQYMYPAGIIGRISQYSSAEIGTEGHPVVNTGKISNFCYGSSQIREGGIAGNCPGRTTFTYCRNTGDIVNNSTSTYQIRLGGIVGSQTFGTVAISYCTNKCTISSKGVQSGTERRIGGIVGSTQTNTGETLPSVSNCKSFTEIETEGTTTTDIKWIIGYIHSDSIPVSNCGVGGKINTNQITDSNYSNYISNKGTKSGNYWWDGQD